MNFVLLVSYILVLTAAVALAIYGMLYLKQVFNVKKELNINLPKRLTGLMLVSLIMCLFTAILVIYAIIK